MEEINGDPDSGGISTANAKIVYSGEFPNQSAADLWPETVPGADKLTSPSVRSSQPETDMMKNRVS